MGHVEAHRREPGHRRSAIGFSLIELTSALAITSVLLAVGVPGYRNFVLDSRRAAVANALLGAMQVARSEALKLGQTVIVCPSADGASCLRGADDWGRGWLTFVNLSGSISPCVVETAANPADIILRYAANDYADFGIRSNRDCYAFRPFSVHLAAGAITICDPRAAADASQARAVIVSSVGRSRIASRNASDEPLNCS